MWTQEGTQQVWDTWIGDSQVRYTLVPIDGKKSGMSWYQVRRQVFGAAQKWSTYVDSVCTPESGMEAAQQDAEKGL